MEALEIVPNAFYGTISTAVVLGRGATAVADASLPGHLWGRHTQDPVMPWASAVPTIVGRVHGPQINMEGPWPTDKHGISCLVLWLFLVACIARVTILFYRMTYLSK